MLFGGMRKEVPINTGSLEQHHKGSSGTRLNSGIFFFFFIIQKKKKKKILISALFLPNYFSSLILSINITLNHIIIMITNFLINKILIRKV